MTERCERCGATFDTLDELLAHAGQRTSRLPLEAGIFSRARSVRLGSTSPRPQV